MTITKEQAQRITREAHTAIAPLLQRVALHKAAPDDDMIDLVFMAVIDAIGGAKEFESARTGTPAELGDFFTRPGQFYAVTIDLAGVAVRGQRFEFSFVTKADDDQKPYLMEVINQMWGAFGVDTRVTISKVQMQIPGGSVARPDPVERAAKSVSAVREFTQTLLETDALGEDNRTPDGGSPLIPGIDVIAPDCGGTVSTADIIAARIDLDIDTVAKQFGVPRERVAEIPMRGGGTAYAITGQPQPQHGRHARPDDNWETAPKAAGLGDHHDDEVPANEISDADVEAYYQALSQHPRGFA